MTINRILFAGDPHGCFANIISAVHQYQPEAIVLLGDYNLEAPLEACLEPIIDKTHIGGVYLNCGWCYGGFKATPASGWTFAHTIAQDKPHELNAGYSLNRFNTGHLLDEKGLGTKTWIS